MLTTSGDGGAQVSKVTAADGRLDTLPRGLSVFDPFLRHEVREALDAGGEAYISQTPDGVGNGLFIYDSYEATGTIFTRSQDVFGRFYKMKPSSYIFSELDVPGLQRENWNIWQLDVDGASIDHRFRHQVSIDEDASEIERFVALAQPETNRRWISVALRHGDKCFVVKVEGRIVGIAWMTMVPGLARSHGLYVEPQYRRRGVMRDNLQARLIYLKSRHVHTLINEIAESNTASSSHAAKAGEKVIGKIYLYTSPEDAPPS